MNYKHIATLLVIACFVSALAWDVWVKLNHFQEATWCQAVRDLNKASNGLLGLCLIALIVHILCVQWFPTAWVHE